MKQEFKLLDVSNLYINSINHKYDPYAFFDKLPKDKINYLHVAGFIRNKYGFLIDSHSEPVHKEVWKLAEYIIKLLDFFPVMYKEETFEFLINKYDQLKKGRLKNLYLENITYTFNWHNNDFSELDFWYKLLNETNIGMFFDKKNEEELNTIRNYFPLIPHGLSLSIGTYEPLSKKKEKQISNLLAELQINSYTDHLAMSSVKDIVFVILTSVSRICLFFYTLHKVENKVDVEG
ncbi:DUF692 family protein [Bacillus licheniformis]|nr:DUF692 family protein [Bacillus licheniformis]